MGNIKQKQEQDSCSGYLMEYDATPLTNQDIHNATVELATGMLQIDYLVEIAYKEASAICQDLLGISAPTVTIDKPLKLAVMGALSQGHKESGTTTDNVATNDDDSDGGGEEILEDDDLGDEEEDIPEDKVDGTECLGDLAVVSAHTTARYSALCEDLEDVAASASAGIMFGPPPPSISSISDKRVQFCNDTHVDGGNSTSLQSQLFDNNGRLSVTRMIRERQALQAQTSTHSERTFEVIVEPNHRLKQVNEENGMKRKLTEKEVAHKLRVAQVKADLSERAKTAREQRWKDTTKAIEKALDTVARQITLVSSGGKRWVSIQRRGRVCVGSFARANTQHPQAEEAGRRKGKGTAAHRSENGGKVFSIVECLVTRLCTQGRGSDASPVLPDR